MKDDFFLHPSNLSVVLLGNHSTPSDDYERPSVMLLKKTQEIVLLKAFLSHYKGHGLVRMWDFYLKKQLKILIFAMKEF